MSLATIKASTPTAAPKRTSMHRPTKVHSDLGPTITYAVRHSAARMMGRLSTSPDGLPVDIAKAKLDLYGPNALSQSHKKSLAARLVSAFISPFTLILIALAVISFYTDVVFAAPGQQDPSTVIIIAIMVTISGSLSFVQETKSTRAAEGLQERVKSSCIVLRRELATGNSHEFKVPTTDVVTGDVVRLAAGDMVCADMRIISSKDLFVAQAALTGESEPAEKTPDAVRSTPVLGEGTRSLGLGDCTNIVFSGTTVQSGSALAVVFATGDTTYLGAISKKIQAKPEKTAFDVGIDDVSRLLVSIMVIMCPLVFFVNGFMKGQWLDAFLFAASVAVGITPQMLPVIVTTCLARGATEMSRHDVIVKKMSAIQNLGAMDILCTDKTGTLTEDKVVLERHLNVAGQTDNRVLRYAFLNSHFQTGLTNLIDQAIIDATKQEEPFDPQLSVLKGRYEKIDEIPFDFERRRMSVVVRAKATAQTQIVTKGAVEEVLTICSSVDYKGKIQPLTADLRTKVNTEVSRLGDEGLRVIAVAHKLQQMPEGSFSVADETDMTLIGYLAFLDPPKASAPDAIASLSADGVSVKVLTGDSEKVAVAVCKKVGIDVGQILTGSEIDMLTDEELEKHSEACCLFAKLSPLQKSRVVAALRKAGHVVGFMGDGINDAAAMRASDVGISVDTAVDVAKKTADIILLKKDLMVLDHGIEEGRRTYGNTIKYVKTTAASNFGNVLSVTVASVTLPFLPMSSLQILLLGLAYTIAAAAIPWDNVDAEMLRTPQRWDASSIKRFMAWMGPISSIFDILTYLGLYFMLCPAMLGSNYAQLDPADATLFIALFQTGWFVESMWTQSLVVLSLRTEHLSILRSSPAPQLIVLTLIGIGLVTLLPYVPDVSDALGLTALPAPYYPLLFAAVAGYLVAVTLAKLLYKRRYGSLL